MFCRSIMMDGTLLSMRKAENGLWQLVSSRHCAKPIDICTTGFCIFYLFYLKSVRARRTYIASSNKTSHPALTALVCRARRAIVGIYIISIHFGNLFCAEALTVLHTADDQARPVIHANSTVRSLISFQACQNAGHAAVPVHSADFEWKPVATGASM